MTTSGQPLAQGRRRTLRFASHADIELRSRRTSGQGVVINASLGGLRVACTAGPPIDEVCVVQLRDPGSAERTSKARVVWRREQPDGFILGLQYVEDTPDRLRPKPELVWLD